MKRSLAIVIAVSGSLCVGAAEAEETRIVHRLTLAETLEAARESSLDVLWVRAKHAEAAGLRKTERADVLPELKGSASQSRQDRSVGAFGLPETAQAAIPDPIPADIDYNISDDLVDAFNLPTEAQITVPEPTDVLLDYSETTGAYDWFDAKLRLTVPIIDAAEYREFRAAAAGERRAELEIAAAEEQAMNRAGELYLQILGAAARVEALREQRALQEKRVASRRDQVAAGTAAEIDLRREQLALSTLTAELNSAAAARDRAARDLARALNLPDAQAVEPADALTFAPQPAPSAEAAFALAIERRADYRAQLEEEKVARLKRDAARAEAWPVLNAFGSYGYQGNRWDDTVEAWAVGVTLDVPIWDSHRRSGRIEQRAGQYAQVVNRGEDLRQGIRVEVIGLLDALALSSNAVAVAREAVALAEDQLRMKRDEAEAGLSTEIDVLAAETDLAKARAAEQEAIYQYALAALRLHAATGDVRAFARDPQAPTESTTTP